MLAATDKIHRILAPRLVVLIGTTDGNGRRNIIPINNITSISTDPGRVIIAVYKPWLTAANLAVSPGFTISVPDRQQLDLVWKLGQKYSGYNSGMDKIEEFKDHFDFNFSEYGPVLKDSLGWIACEIVDIPKDIGGNHLLVIGKYSDAMVNPLFFTEELSPMNNPKPFMQWERNSFSEASDVFTVDYFKDPSEVA